MSTSADRFEKGKPVGAWTLLEALDRDLAAPVWVADDGTRVAYVRHFRVYSPRVVERLDQVTSWAASYEHNSILPMLEHLRVESGVAIISLYEEGQLLSSVIGKANLARKPVPVAVAATIALDLLDALHATGGRLAPAWAHGGLRPECTLITRGGRARVMALGAAGVVGATDPLARDPKWAAYASPEQVETGKPSHSSDVFSVGVLLWEMLVNRPLFQARNFDDVKKKLLDATIERADERARTRVPERLADVVAQALERAPHERFETPKAFAGAIAAAAGEVAERHEVSDYLEQLHVVALDTRRRSLERLIGRPPPTSIPPAPRDRPKRITSMAPPAIPKLTSRAPQVIPKAPAIPSTVVRASAKPSAQPKPAASQPPRTRARSEAPLPLVQRVKEPEPEQDETPLATASEIDVVVSERGESPPPSLDVEFSVAGDSGPPSEDVEFSLAGQSLPGSMDVELAAEAEPSGIDVEVSVAEAAAAELDAIDEGWGDAEDDEAEAAKPAQAQPAEEPEPASEEEAPVDEEAVAEEGPPIEREAAAEAQPADEPAPAAPKPAASTPPVDLAALVDDADLLAMQRPRRWPTLLIGIGVGVGVTLAVLYGKPLLDKPAPPPATSEPSTPPPEPAPPPEPEPEPSASTAASASASASASADAEEKPPKRGAKPRPKPRPKPRARPAAAPAPKPAPAPQPAPPPPPPPPSDEVYE